MRSYRESERVTDKTVELRPPDQKGKFVGQLIGGWLLIAIALGGMALLFVQGGGALLQISFLVPFVIGALILANRSRHVNTKMLLSRTQEIARLDIRHKGTTIESIEAPRATTQVQFRESPLSTEERRTIMVVLKMAAREIEVGGPYPSFADAQRWSDSLSSFLGIEAPARKEE